MYDLMSFGTISVDLYFDAESLTHDKERFHLAIGGKYQPQKFNESIGGGGANVAIGCYKYGLRTAVIGYIGNNEFKSFIQKKLHNSGISDYYCAYEDNYYNISVILLTASGERTVLHYYSHNQEIADFGYITITLSRARNIYFGSFSDIPLYERLKMLKYCKEHSIRTFLNLSASDCEKFETIDALVKTSDVLILNGHEFAALVKKPYEKLDFKDDVVKKYLEYMSDKIVIVTDSKNGSYGYSNGETYHQKALEPEKIVDTTGAGDGYSAGFISSYLQDQDIKNAMESGAQYAAKILQKMGANEL